MKVFLQFIKFGLVGVSNTLISIFFFNIFIAFNIDYMVANTVAYGIGILNSYFINTKWVFNKTYSKDLMKKFIFINLLMMVLNNMILFLITNALDINISVAQVLAMGIGVIINFIFNKVFVFKI